eukprot:353987-Chlamydomonas_euryale.AAC.2
MHRTEGGMYGWTDMKEGSAKLWMDGREGGKRKALEGRRERGAGGNMFEYEGGSEEQREARANGREGAKPAEKEQWDAALLEPTLMRHTCEAA